MTIQIPLAGPESNSARQQHTATRLGAIAAATQALPVIVPQWLGSPNTCVGVIRDHCIALLVPGTEGLQAASFRTRTHLLSSERDYSNLGPRRFECTYDR